MTLRFQKSLQQQQSGEVVHPAPADKVTIRNCSSTTPDPAIVTLAIPDHSAESECPHRRMRDRLLEWKRKEPDRDKRMLIAECLADLDEIERSMPAAAVDEWLRQQSPALVAPSSARRNVLNAFLINGKSGVSREEIDAIISGDAMLEASGSIVRVRMFISRFRESLKKSNAAATITKAGRDGIYHTAVTAIQTFRKV